MSQVFFELPIVFNCSNNIFKEFEPLRSYSWDISIESVDKGFYGYGYGVSFYDLDSVGALDYFHVIGVSGTTYGYGISSTIGDTIDEFNFGWGYEFAPAIISDNEDSITVVATVTENDIPVPNVKVVFIGSTGTNLSVNSGITDINGQIKTDVKIDGNIQSMKILDKEDDKKIIFEIKSTISNTVMIGDVQGESNDWIVYLPKGKLPEQFRIPTNNSNEFEKIRISITDFQREYSVSYVKPTEVFKILGEDRWALRFKSTFNYPFNSLGDIEEPVFVGPTTLQIFKTVEENKKFEKIPINGWMNIRAYIDEGPQKEDKKIKIKMNSNQETYEKNVFNLIFNSYSFQNYNFIP